MKEFEQAAMQVFSKLPEDYPLPPQSTTQHPAGILPPIFCKAGCFSSTY